jgi:hypothetical protein
MGLARVTASDGGPHTDLREGHVRVGSIWPSLPHCGGPGWWSVVCAGLDWCLDTADEDTAASMLAQHRAADHGEGW